MKEDNKPLFGIPSKREVDVGEVVISFFVKGRKRPYKRIVRGKTYHTSVEDVEAYTREVILHWGSRGVYEVSSSIFIPSHQVIKITVGKRKPHKIWIEYCDEDDVKVNKPYMALPAGSVVSGKI